MLQTYWNKWDHRGEIEPPQYVIILPNAVDIDRYGYTQKLVHAGNGIGDARNQRYAQAQRIAAEVMQERGYSRRLLQRRSRRRLRWPWQRCRPRRRQRTPK